MNYTDLQLQFEQSATLRLLRSGNAPLVLAVLFAAFKREHHPVVPESRLRALLEAEIEELRDAGDFASGRLAKDYLTEWADPEHAYLHRFQPADSDEPAYELTPEIERVFQWLDSLKPRPHVRTESKFKNLAGTLAEIVETQRENQTCESSGCGPSKRAFNNRLRRLNARESCRFTTQPKSTNAFKTCSKSRANCSAISVKLNDTFGRSQRKSRFDRPTRRPLVAGLSVKRLMHRIDFKNRARDRASMPFGIFSLHRNVADNLLNWSKRPTRFRHWLMN